MADGDEAKPREAAAVLSNSRTEPVPAPQTPTKSSYPQNSFGLQTPHTNTVKYHSGSDISTPKTPSKSSAAPRNGGVGESQNTNTTLSTSDEEFFDWPGSDDEEVFKAADEASSVTGMPPPETPSKAAKIQLLSSPGKRRYSRMEDGNTTTVPTSSDAGDNVFVTPNISVKRDGLFTASEASSSPVDTPTPKRFKDALRADQASELSSEVLRVLQEAKTFISPTVRAELMAVCEKHTMSARGILKGRDISRAMVNAKNAMISEMQDTIAALQAERETNRAVIRHLRRDMETARLEKKS
ncbi:MAG: hypothetical protein Q9219_002538 [cf. Caloplaca sp. 3 TL-2023]